MSGILLLNKPAGMTSHDAVNIVRKLYNTKKVGHTGTLDPMATGLLVVLVGDAVKVSELLVSSEKSYFAGMKLGITTDTEDVTGKILSTFSGTLPDKNTVFSVCEHFVGNYMQIPPMYSALKVGGKKLVDLARNGVTVDREPREVSVTSLCPECVSEENGEYSLNVKCSKGTYIRTLCADIGKTLGCGAVMSSLERRENGGFSLADAHTLEEISNAEFSGREKLLVPVENAFTHYSRLDVSGFYARLFRNGVRVYAKNLSGVPEIGTRLRLYEGGTFFALAEVITDAEGIKSVMVLRQFGE